MSTITRKRKSYDGRDGLVYTIAGDRKKLNLSGNAGYGSAESDLEDGVEEDDEEDGFEGFEDSIPRHRKNKPPIDLPSDEDDEDSTVWHSTNAALALPERVSLRPVSRIPQKPPDGAPSRPPLPTSFSDLGVSAALIRALTSMSIKRPTEIQAACVPPLLKGLDCIGNAKTGSGKTIAFALPILHQLSLDPYGIFALVLTPTRELAFQIADQFAVLGAHLNARTAVVVGGMDMMTQATELCGRPHVVVATPGRLVDLMKSGSGEWSLGRLRFLILDEADRLLTPTFAADLAYLFAALPASRQTGLFTATLTPAIEALADAPPRPGKQKPFIHRVTSDMETVETLQQHYLLCPSHIRELFLYYLLCNPPESIVHLRRDPPPLKPGKKQKKSQPASDAPPLPPPTIIFTTHPRTAARLTLLLQHLQIPTTALHSHLTQRQRLTSLGLFRAHVVPVLVATDVASRGLDIEEVALVVNWDMPEEGREEEYVHRVGRTARKGRGGVAVSFIGEREGGEAVGRIEKRIKTQLTEMVIPEGKAIEHLNLVSTAKRLANMELHDTKFGAREAIRRKKRAAKEES